MEYISQDMKKLHTLMDKINKGALRLPSFQRKYVWKYADVISLLDSIENRYPAGSLLFYETGGSNLSSEKFKYSEANVEAEHLVMDGQQRLTSCYNVFYDNFANTFFIDLINLYNQHKARMIKSIDFGDSIIIRKKKKKQYLKWMDEDLLPFPVLKDRDEMRDYLKAYRNKLRSEPDKADYLDFVETHLETYLDPFFEYQFPIIILPKDLTLSAVCKIFQTVNTTGVKLDSFDICVAKFSSEGIDLKKMLSSSCGSGPADLVIDDDKYKIITLQVIALITGNDSKKNQLVNLEAKDVTANWEKVVDSLNDTLTLLDDFGVGTTKNLSLVSYDVMITVIAAVLISVQYRDIKKADDKARVEKIIKQYYYYASFNERYKDGGATKLEVDYKAVTNWILNGAVPDRNTVKAGQIFYKGGLKWTEDEIVSIKKGSTSAIGKAILSALNHQKLIDFYTEKTVGIGEKIAESEQHHIFPSARYADRVKSGKYKIDSIFNITFISKETNNHIKDRSTVEYYNLITKIKEIKTENEFKSVLNKHGVNDEGLKAFLNEDYEAFIEARIAAIKKILVDSIGLEIRLTSVDDDYTSMEDDS
ncbi:hypothetical protein AR505_0330 [methanogenic archaeon ISO4-H5]|nr:hypothetical protein AR505_0330 [methanogenic archaeon ISO4-H5]